MLVTVLAKARSNQKKTVAKTGDGKRSLIPRSKIPGIGVNHHPSYSISDADMKQIPRELTKGDPYLLELFRTCQQRRFSSADMNIIMKKAGQVRKIYKEAQWAGEADWPLFIEILVDMVRTKGARPSIEMIEEHLQETVTGQFTGHANAKKLLQQRRRRRKK